MKDYVNPAQILENVSTIPVISLSDRLSRTVTKQLIIVARYWDQKTIRQAMGLLQQLTHGCEVTIDLAARMLEEAHPEAYQAVTEKFIAAYELMPEHLRELGESPGYGGVKYLYDRAAGKLIGLERYANATV